MKKLARAFQGIKMRKLIIGTIMAVALLGLPAGRGCNRSPLSADAGDRPVELWES